MARSTTARKAAKKAAPKSSRSSTSRGGAPAGYGSTETDADERQAARDHTTEDTAEFGTAPYTAGAPNIQTGAIDRAIAQGERARFRR